MRLAIAAGLVGLGLLVAFGAGAALLTYPADLRAFLDSGRMAATAANPYAGYHPNMNAPATVPMFHALATYDAATLGTAWRIASLAAYLVSLLLLLREYPERRTALFVAWALALSPLWDTLLWGQLYTFLLLPVTLAWLALKRGRYLLAGIAIGLLIAIKPNFLIWPALLLLSGGWTVCLGAGLSALAVSALPALLYGPGVYTQWMAASGAQAAGHIISEWDNATLWGLAAHLGYPQAGALLAAALLLPLAWWALRGKAGPLQVSAIALVASLLASPIAWLAYSVLLLPLFAHYRWTRPVAAAALLLLVPALYPPLGALWYTIALSMARIAMLGGMVWLLTRPGRLTTP